MPFSMRSLAAPAVLLLAVSAYVGAQRHVLELPRERLDTELMVSLPPLVQVAMSGGDRYLAANLATWRALVATTGKMAPEKAAVQGMVQRDAAWMNPAHEDNFYVAAAILPWNGRLDDAQYVLKRAMAARSHDMWPGFYYAFNVYFFEKDAPRAARILMEEADKAGSERNKLTMQAIASRWAQKGANTDDTARFLRALADQSNHAAFRHYLLQSAQRVENLIVLQGAVDLYGQRSGAQPMDFDAVVKAGVLQSIPVDPLGGRYEIKDGKVVVVLDRRQGK